MTDAIQTVREAALLGEWAKFDHYMTRVEAVVKAAEHHADTAPAGSHHLLREAVKRYRAALDPTEAPEGGWHTANRSGSWVRVVPERGTTP